MLLQSTKRPKVFLDILPKEAETENTFNFGGVNDKSNNSLEDKSAVS